MTPLWFWDVDPTPYYIEVLSRVLVAAGLTDW
jgi:hypothetical protein